MTQVMLTDESGKVLAVTQLGASSGFPVVVYTYSFGSVPDGPTFYSDEVSHRGKITESAAELAAAGWTFDTVLGTP